MSGLTGRVPVLSNPQRVVLLPVDPSRPCGARMKGFGLLHLLQHAEATYGATAMKAWAEALPTPLQSFANVKGLTSIGWLPMELYFSAIDYLVKTQHGNDSRAAIDLGHTMATRGIGAFFLAAMSFATPPTVVSLASRFWRTFFDAGELVIVKKSAASVDAELRSWPLVSEVVFFELAGSFVAWLEASKAKDVRVSRFLVSGPSTLSLTLEWS